MGKFLWNIHLTHHLPDAVYVIVHAVFNPIQALITVIIVQLPLILLGVPPEVVLIGTLLIDLQSLVSHFNMDLRMGFLNYIFIGSETHRLHHTGDTIHAKNF
jgi:sterol desaturase/sphingolipid hydroxylase (fatty acid hydroxylase superfamily)